MKVDFKLSIVIPYYETYELTKKLLERLVPQLTEDTELIIVDDGCNETRLDEFEKGAVEIVHLEENGGATHALNTGIDRTTGKYIAIIDSDDLIAGDYVETLLNAIDTRNEDLIYFDWQDMNTHAVVHHPRNYAPWKCIYKRDMMPRFVDGWIFSYDVPFQEEINKIPHTEYFIDKVLYFYNSNRPGNLTLRKKAYIENQNRLNKGENK